MANNNKFHFFLSSSLSCRFGGRAIGVETMTPPSTGFILGGPEMAPPSSNPGPRGNADNGNPFIKSANSSFV